MNKKKIRIFYSKNVASEYFAPTYGRRNQLIIAIKNKYRDYYSKLV